MGGIGALKARFGGKGGRRPDSRCGVLLVVALTTGLATGCGGSDEGGGGQRSADGGTAVICLRDRPTGLNPFVAPDLAAADFLPVLYTPLVRYDAQAGFSPWLARQWSWDDAHRSLTFSLRDDVRWHDGSPVTAEDVAWTIRLAADTAFGYWVGEDFRDVQDVERPDSLTVVVHYARPAVSDVEPFAILPILPKHVLGELTPQQLQQAPFNREPVGSGPYRVSERRPNGDLVLTRFEQFPAALGRGSLARIVFRAVPETATQLVEIQTGGVQGCVTSAAAATAVKRTAGLEMQPVPPTSVRLLPLRTDRAPFRDARVRRAISAALDRRELALTVSPLARPAGTFLPLESPFLVDSLAEPDADTALADSLLESAGWTRRDGEALRRGPRGERLSFTITGPEPYRDMLTIVQAQLRRVGIDAQLRMMETAAFVGLLGDSATRPTAMALSMTPTKIRSYDPTPDLGSGPDNFSSYSSARVDSLLATLRQTSDAGRRRQLYEQLQRQVARDVPAVYLLYLPRVFVTAGRLEGVQPGLNGPFDNVMRWRLRTSGRTASRR